MKLGREHLWYLETWLQEGDLIRRAGSGQSISKEAFEEQRRQTVSYAIFEHLTGTYSDGRGGLPAYKRIE